MTRVLRAAAVRILSTLLIVALVLPGPLQGLARAEAGRKALRSAVTHMGIEQNEEPVPPSPPSAKRVEHSPPAKRGAALAEAVLPVPLRPAAVEWIAPSSVKQDPWTLFDGRATTGLQASSSEPVRIGVILDAPTELAAVTLLGPAEGKLTVLAIEGERAVPVESLDAVSVRVASGEWKRLEPPRGVVAQKLVITWVSSTPLGPTEVGLWGYGLPKHETSDSELADRVLAGAALGGTSTVAAPTEARVARVGLQANAAARPDRPAIFHATLAADPRSLARTFLVYELTGLGHFTEVVRQVNGLQPRGGAPLASPGGSAGDSRAQEGGLQVEEISPDWLRVGDNEIRFFPVLDPGGPEYAVRNVRIVGLGRASVVEARMSDGQRGAAQPLAFDAKSQPHDVVFDVLQPSDGRLVVQPVGAKGQSSVTVDLHGMAAGWHRIDASRLGAVDGVTVALTEPKRGGARSHAEAALPAISEVAVTASPLPAAGDAEGIVVTYPLHGECFDHRARVRGFVRSAEGSAPVAAFHANGAAFDDAVARDGSFELTVEEPAAQKGQRWTVGLEAKLAGGALLQRDVHMDRCIDRPEAKDGAPVEDEGAPFAQVVRPDEGTTIAYAGARLEIPKGAVDHDVRITVRPLVHAQVPKMDARMANVSPDGRAFRFGPHGLKFKKPVKLTLPYDADALARAMHERNIFGFYFDETQKKWARIGRFGNPQDGALVSLTEHFTDFVNATLAMPDEPGVKSFSSDEMKGIKLASPSAGLDLIAAPEVSSSGAATLSYPIEVPPGRNGMEPHLAFAYSSEGQNAWMGVGWDLGVSSVVVDTRFGVPRYEKNNFNDSYMIDGTELTPSPSGAAGTYVRRVEGRFDLIRRNTDPASGCPLSWTVTDRTGAVFTYGGPGAVLSDPNNACHVFRWGLSSVQDTFGNILHVKYFTDSGTSGSEPFTALYPDSMTYTAHRSGLQPAYKVQFVRDGGASRPDMIVNGRPGFQEKIRFLLDHVDVLLEQPSEQIIRRYQLSYLPDSLSHFHKSLLGTIALQGSAAGPTPPQSVTPTVQLDQHTFDYFAANVTPVGSTQQVAAFAQSQTWGTGPRPNDALTRSDDTMGGGSLSVGFGFAGIFSATVGGGANSGDMTNRLGLFDVDGDATPDLIDDTGNGTFNFFRPNLSVPSPVPGQLQPASIAGMPGLGHTNQSGWSVQGGISISVVGASVSYSNTSTDDDRALADIDGDGLVDLVTLNNGIVTWFKNNGPNGFGPGQTGTGAILPNGLTPDPNLAGQTAQAGGQVAHRVEPLVRWVAPFSGPIAIPGTITKAVPGGNGVDVFIFKNATPVFTTTLADGGTTTCVPSIGNACCVPTPTNDCSAAVLTDTVVPGDAYYVFSAPHHDPTLTGTALAQELGRETQGNQVQYAPTFSYTNAPPGSATLRESYGAHVFQFSQTDDFRPYGGAVQPWFASADGNVHVDASFGTTLPKGTTSDDVSLTVTYTHFNPAGNTVSSFPQTAFAGSTSPTTFGVDLQVFQGDRIDFSMASKSGAPIDPARVGWVPTVTYTNYCLIDPATGSDACGVPNCPTIGNPHSSCTIVPSPEPQLTIPAGLISQVGVVAFSAGHFLYAAPTSAFVAPTDGTYTLSGHVTVSNLPGTSTILLQGVNQLFAQFPATGSADIDLSGTSVALKAGDELFLTVLSVATSPLVTPLITSQPTVNGQQLPVNVIQRDPVFDSPDVAGFPVDPMSGGFHGWWTGFFDGETPFNPALIPPTTDASGNEILSPAFSFASPLGQSTTNPSWGGPGGASIGAGSLVATRADAASPGGLNGGLNSLKHANTWDLNLGLDVQAGISGGFKLAQGETNTDHDFFDFNGDRYPDALSFDGNLQLGDGTGNFATPITIPAVSALPALHHASHASFGVNLGTDIKLIHDVDSDGTVRKLLTTGLAAGNNYGVTTHQVDWIDVNGDGLADAVTRSPGDVNSGNTDFIVRLNYGYGLSSPVHWAAGKWDTNNEPATGVGSVLGASNVNSLFTTFGADVGVNGVRMQDSGTNTVNLGGQFGVAGASVGAGAGWSFNVTRSLVDMVDINGDSLPDEVMRVPGEQFVRVRLNLGDHFDTQEIEWPLPDWPTALDTDPDSLGYTLVDLGDINQPLSFRRNKTFTTSFSAQVCFFLCVGGSGFFSTGNSWMNTSFDDVDGDGLPDMVLKARGGSTVYVKRNLMNEPSPAGSPGQAGPVAPVNRLLAVHRPLGGTFTLSYTREGNLVRTTPRTDEPTNKYVLASVDVDDGRANHYLRHFQYTPTGIHDRIERQDYGFAQVTTVIEDNSTIEEDFENTDFYRAGMTKTTIFRDSASNVFSVHSFAFAAPPSTTPVRTGSFFPAEQSRETDNYEGASSLAAPHLSLVQTRHFDPTTGSLIAMTDQGDVAPGAGQVSYTITYDPVLQAEHIFKPSEIIAKDVAGNVLRDRIATYDPATGAFKTVTSVVTGGTDPSGNPYTGTTNLEWSFVFDGFGNLAQATDPTGYQLHYQYDAVAQTYRTNTTDSFQYTSLSAPEYRFGTPVTETDPNGNIVLFKYDDFGRLIAADAPQDIATPEHTMVFEYSEQGRPIASIPAGGGASNPFPAQADSRHKDVIHPGDPIETATFVDGINRVIQTKKNIDRDFGTGSPTRGVSVSGATVFDGRGRVSQQGQPVFSTVTDPTMFVNAQANGPSCPAPAPPCPVNATTFQYDAVSRVTQSTRPDGARTQTQYAVGPGPDGNLRGIVTLLDPNVVAGGGLPGVPRITYSDVHANVVAVQDSNRLDMVHSTPLIAQYAYDGLDELLQVTDTKGNVTTATYDSVGRMVAVNGPDTGLTQFNYDHVGNLGSKQTAQLRAKNEAVAYQYDPNSGRLHQITYPESPPVIYTYGDFTETSLAGFNRAGRVKQEQSEAGLKSYEYDELGNVSQQFWALNRIDEPPGTETFDATMAYTYDTFGRRLTMAFPGNDNEVVRYGYDHGGNVTSAVGVDKNGAVTNYLVFIGYDEFEQRDRLVSGNGVQTSYRYDPLTRRLTQINADQRDPELVKDNRPARPFQRMRYAYDPVGNLTQIRNDAPFDPTLHQDPAVGPVVENFTYDDLYQLKTSDGLYQEDKNKRFHFGLSFSYDAISNITQKALTSDTQNLNGQGAVVSDTVNQQQTYSSSFHYQSTRPHAPTEVDDRLHDQELVTRTFSYDASGNQTGFVKGNSNDHRVMVFDEENRLQQVIDNGDTKVQKSLYDGSGQRAVKAVQQAGDQVAYFGPNLTLRDNPTRHVFAGATRVASKLQIDDDGVPEAIDYFHDDHLGSTNFTTDAAQNLVAHEEYFPDGELWVDETKDSFHTNQPYLFTGKELDVETGLYYFGSRYYDPRLSMFITPDPALAKYMHGAINTGVYMPGHLGLYTYALNNPIMFLDPNGQWEVHWGTVARSAGKAFVIGVAVGAGAALIIASAGTAAPAVACAFAFAGGVTTGIAVGEVVTGVDLHGNKLTDEQRSEVLGDVLGGTAGAALGGGAVSRIPAVRNLALRGGAAPSKGGGVGPEADGTPPPAAEGAPPEPVADPAPAPVADTSPPANAPPEATPWKGPTDYSKIPDPKNVNASTKPTPRQVREMKKANRAWNGGVLRSDMSGKPMIDSSKSTSDVTPPPNEAQVDHKVAVDNGGTRTQSNLELITRQENRAKWNK
jgi:RHS repeat-associated protein